MLSWISRLIMSVLSIVVDGQGLGGGARLTGQDVAGFEFIGFQGVVFVHFKGTADDLGATGTADPAGTRKWCIGPDAQCRIEHGFIRGNRSFHRRRQTVERELDRAVLALRVDFDRSTAVASWLGGVPGGEEFVPAGVVLHAGVRGVW